MTVAAVTAALNITYEGLLVTVLLIMMKKVPSSKEHTQFKTRVQTSYPIYDQNGQNRYPQIYGQTVEKPYPLGPHKPI